MDVLSGAVLHLLWKTFELHEAVQTIHGLTELSLLRIRVGDHLAEPGGGGAQCGVVQSQAAVVRSSVSCRARRCGAVDHGTAQVLFCVLPCFCACACACARARACACGCTCASPGCGVRCARVRVCGLPSVESRMPCYVIAM